MHESPHGRPARLESFYGPLTGLAFGNNVVLSLSYDHDYQLTGINAALGASVIQNLTNVYDADGNVLSITDALTPARTQTFTYDNLNRLKTASGLYGSLTYTYDKVGNRLTLANGTSTDTYAISSTANQVSTVTTSGSGNVRSFSYLPTGQASGDTRNPSSAYVYTYNKTGRLASASLNGSTVGTYLMNGLEQRVSKVVGSTTTQFVFDRFGHLIAEADGATGTTQKEYIWLDDLPVAEIDDTGSSPVMYFVHTDHLGRPQKMTDATATIVWDGVFDPFGNVTSVTGSATNLLMFPGQYYDSETQLSQNWNRDYDPSVGRYIQSDPIGLKGGINTYGYVGGNPITRSDTSGLVRGFDPDSDYCKSLRRRMENLEKSIARRTADLATNRLGLPYDPPYPGAPPGASQSGHEDLIQKDQNDLERLRKQYDQSCRCGGTPAPLPPPLAPLLPAPAAVPEAVEIIEAIIAAIMAG